MIPEQRIQKIIDKLKANGICTIKDLSDEFGVSRVTIQRDVKALKRKGLIDKLHGGFKIKENIPRIETIFSIRIKRNSEKKLEIAKKAQEFVKSGDTIFLDASSTVFSFGVELFKRKFTELNVITNSPSIIEEILHSDTNIKVFSVGGELDISWNMLKGNWTINCLEKINIDKAFISAAGISADHMLTTSHHELANVLRAVIKKSHEVNLLIDSTKILKPAMVGIAGLKDITRIISDSAFNNEEIKNIEGLEIVY